jgi:DNA-binding transcriptional regulator YiaG
MVKRKPSATRKTGARRGGRKPGAWALVTPEALRGWRETQKMSRASVASTLGVSSTSVQNWETGHAVATAKMQQKLADLMKAPAPAGGARSRGSSTPASNGAARHPANGDPTLIQATASIVIEAIRAGGKKDVSAKELGVLVRTVRDALA